MATKNADELIELLTIEEGRTFFFPLSEEEDGDKIVFRMPADGVEYHHIRKRMAQWVKVVKGGRFPAVGADLPAAFLEKAFLLHEFAIEPTFTVEQSVRLGKSCGPLLDGIHNLILANIVGAVVKGDVEAIDEAGEDSGMTPTTAPS